MTLQVVIYGWRCCANKRIENAKIHINTVSMFIHFFLKKFHIYRSVILLYINYFKTIESIFVFHVSLSISRISILISKRALYKYSTTITYRNVVETRSILWTKNETWYIFWNRSIYYALQYYFSIYLIYNFIELVP